MTLPKKSLKIAVSSSTAELIEKSKFYCSLALQGKTKCHNVDNCKKRTAEFALGFTRKAYPEFSAKLYCLYGVLSALIFRAKAI